MSNESVNVIGVKSDGSSELLGTTSMPPSMKRAELATEQFGAMSVNNEDGNNADCCLFALEMYHEWLIANGWKAPDMVIVPPSA